uniref:Uncharacterized protein n=1 Tax=Phytophthora fragariae TaxID=53985 RepID=A0A6A3FP27_9STRA|nr:hypothetical protein PF009_g4245 [Phytophthora fragariae]
MKLFDNMIETVHVNESHFYVTQPTRRFLMLSDDEGHARRLRSKRYITKQTEHNITGVSTLLLKPSSLRSKTCMTEIISQLPPQLKCRLSVMSGELLTICSDKVPGHGFIFMIADCYDILHGHIKRTNHAPQKDYIQVATDSNAMEAQFSTIWLKARIRKHGHATFVLMLYDFVSRPRAQRLTSLRRATDSLIQEQLPRIVAYMPEHTIVGVPASERYAVIIQAQSPGDAPVQAPGDATIRQLRFIVEEEDHTNSNINAVAMVSNFIITNMLGPLPALLAKEEIARWKSELILRSPTSILDVITYGTKRYNAALGDTNNKYDRWYNTGRVLAATDTRVCLPAEAR